MNTKITTAIDKLNNISNELNDIFVERERVIENCIKALITGQAVLLIGPPGTAKSAMTNALCSRIENGRYFSWLLNRTSDPSEILGPYSIKEMENDKFLRVTKGKLPEAEIAFLDEVFKCNEPTLNILLPIINEKLFYNDGHPIDVPLITLFAASNEFPEDDSLMALYDRMMFRIYVDYIGDIQNKMKMFNNFLNGNDKADKYTTISLDELRLLRNTLKEVKIPDSILKEYISLMNLLFQNGIIISDRRQNECLNVLRATALLNKRDEVILTDLKALKDVLWSKLEDIEKVEEILKEKIVSPFEKEYKNIKKQYKELISSSTNLNDTRIIVEIKNSLEYLNDKSNRLIKQPELVEKDIKNKLLMLIKEITNQIETLSKQIDDDDLLMFGA